jgi:colanic acid biosynthesis glycosyl transferase WcaI
MELGILPKKRILILGINFSPELTGIGKYTGEMTDWFVENGYQCTVVTSFPYYPNWKVQQPYSGSFYKKESHHHGMLNVYRCPLYVPESPSGLKRMLHDASFFISALLMIILLLFKGRNDHIFCVAPPFHIGFLGIFYRFFKGGKIIYHIHDLQIEAARDLSIIKNKTTFQILFALERFIINQANHVSSISIGMIRKLARKTDKEILFIPNWVDTDIFHPIKEKSMLKSEWGFDPTDKLVLYSGSIGEKQGLESLISIAKKLEWNISIKFIICGNGPYKEKLRQLSEENQLSNMFFMALQPLHIFNNFLNMVDIHLVLQKKMASDLMMPSKLSSIWSTGGLAIVTAEQGSSLRSMINENKMAVVIDCENEALLMDSILDCCENDYNDENLNCRKYAEKFLNKQNILHMLMEQIDDTQLVSLEMTSN